MEVNCKMDEQKYIELREATVALLRHLKVKSGYWNLGVRFALGVGSFTNEQSGGSLPTGFVQVVEIGVQQTPENTINAMTVDASDVNRRLTATKPNAPPEAE